MTKNNQYYAWRRIAGALHASANRAGTAAQFELGDPTVYVGSLREIIRSICMALVDASVELTRLNDRAFMNGDTVVPPAARPEHNERSGCVHADAKEAEAKARRADAIAAARELARKPGSRIADDIQGCADVEWMAGEILRLTKELTLAGRSEIAELRDALEFGLGKAKR